MEEYPMVDLICNIDLVIFSYTAIANISNICDKSSHLARMTTPTSEPQIASPTLLF